MVRNRNRLTNRGVDKTILELAARELAEKKCSIQKMAKAYEMPMH